MVSIVSVTYRSLVDTKQFVESVLTNTLELFEFIIGANGPQEDDLKQYLRNLELDGKAKLVWNPRNVGVRAFNQVMRLATSDWIFRCDSDIIIEQPYWTQGMKRQWEVSNKEIGNVIAVGTSNTGGVRIQRSLNTTETDMIMSNCILIHRPTAMQMVKKLLELVPTLETRMQKVLNRGEFYKGEHGDARAALDYCKYHAPYWDPNFGGPDEPLGYGADDMLWSILARWAGFNLVTSRVQVTHKDASARPEYKDERHRLVSRGFQYLRTNLSLIMDVWKQEDWNGLPQNLPVLRQYRESRNINLKT